MTCPVLQLKVSRLRHEKNRALSDYVWLFCDVGPAARVVGQVVKRRDGHLSIDLIESGARISIDPVSLRRWTRFGPNYEIVSAERMPDNMREYLAGCDISKRVKVARSWFLLSEPYANTLHEIL